jgi:hypothetical protein
MNGQRTIVINGIIFIILMNILKINVGALRNSLFKQIIIETMLQAIPNILKIIERIPITALILFK